MRKIILVSWLTILIGCVGVLFWYNDWQYRLPTPVPVNYKAVATGVKIDRLAGIRQEKGKPLFLHFFNPVCPCSKFNFQHFKSLVRKYGETVDFAIVVMSNKNYTAEEIQQSYAINLPVIFNADIAVACGVYSTPQAVLVDGEDRLFYRGNYNSNRYCTDKKTEYARIALDALLDEDIVDFDQAALKAYGCTLPNCSKK